MIETLLGILAWSCVLIPSAVLLFGLIWFCIQLIKIYPKDND